MSEDALGLLTQYSFRRNGVKPEFLLIVLKEVPGSLKKYTDEFGILRIFEHMFSIGPGFSLWELTLLPTHWGNLLCEPMTYTS